MFSISVLCVCAVGKVGRSYLLSDCDDLIMVDLLIY